MNVPASEFDYNFTKLMRERMEVSYYKYGPVSLAYPTKIDAIGSLRDRLRKYAETGNTEFLVDAANFAMIEFMHPRHPSAHFKPTDSDASPGRRELTTGLSTTRRNDEVGGD